MQYTKTISKLFLSLVTFLMVAQPVYASVNPLNTPNNKFGVHIISAATTELQPASQMVNSGGDWGYVTVLIQQNDRDQNKWQNFFNEMRREHVIPIVRIASSPDGNNWTRPDDSQIEQWADFLNSLNWPIKNRYIIIYNEPNHATEWGGSVDAANYAQTLNKMIDTFKSRSGDFFILNAGLDASAPQKPPNYEDEANFLAEMNTAVPGIFNKLDGWSSHSYPNPGFIGSPDGQGKGSVRTWQWELQTLKTLGVNKYLPVFITETGWKHSEGINYDTYLPTADTVGQYYKQAFDGAWSDSEIVAVTPFLLDYQQEPFDHFSFKKTDTQDHNGGNQVLGATTDNYYSAYADLKQMPKVKGQPVQDQKAELTKGSIFSSVVTDETYDISLTLKNTGQTIWNDETQVQLQPVSKDANMVITGSSILPDKKVEPGQDYTFNVEITATKGGTHLVALNLFAAGQQFQNQPFQFTTEAKSPVNVTIKSTLKWKNNYAGEYFLTAAGAITNTISAAVNNLSIFLNENGNSSQIETRSLLPDYTYDFTLERPFYKPKTIRQTVHSGVNELDFGELQPDIPSAILHPVELWNLLPVSNP